MAFTEHKITAFQHRIADLPDQPNLPSNELKARFDSSPEELRLAHNAVCDDAARLDARVAGMIEGTFPDAITKEMLSSELAAEINAKAEQLALVTYIDAEGINRIKGDNALDARIKPLESLVPKKAEVEIRTYGPSSSDNLIIRFENETPQAIIVCPQYASYGAIMVNTSRTAYANGTKQANLVDYGSYSALWLYDMAIKNGGLIMIFR